MKQNYFSLDKNLKENLLKSNNERTLLKTLPIIVGNGVLRNHSFQTLLKDIHFTLGHNDLKFDY